MSEKTLVPEAVWAQRSNADDASKNIVYLTIAVPDVEDKDLKIDLTPTSLSYTGTTRKQQTYHVAFDFFAEIDVEESKKIHTPRATEFILRKKEKKEEFWPQLIKEKGKLHWLKTDFDKWVDEDEQEGGADLDSGIDSSMMSQFGGGGGDPSMMSQFGGGQGFEGIDFSKLGGAQDLSGMGMGMDSAEEMEGLDADSDEDLPDLEGEAESGAPGEKMAVDTEEGSGKGKAKIEELD